MEYKIKTPEGGKKMMKNDAIFQSQISIFISSNNSNYMIGDGNIKAFYQNTVQVLTE